MTDRPHSMVAGVLSPAACHRAPLGALQGGGAPPPPLAACDWTVLDGPGGGGRASPRRAARRWEPLAAMRCSALLGVPEGVGGAAAARRTPLDGAACPWLEGTGTTAALHALLGAPAGPERGWGSRRGAPPAAGHAWGRGRGTSCARLPSLAATVGAATVVTASTVAGVDVTATSADATGALGSATVVLSVPATTNTTVGCSCRRCLAASLPAGCPCWPLTVGWCCRSDGRRRRPLCAAIIPGVSLRPPTLFRLSVVFWAVVASA